MPSSIVPPAIPERYDVREENDGRFLRCDEAPRVRVLIDPKLSLSESEARARGERIILLDGAGDFGPLLDNKARVYNLDHHQGCVRPFTLATCEQALVLILNGLELDEGDWTVYANEPDLDTVFAIWVLLNFRRIPNLSHRSRDILLPLLRLEGAIDANGSEVAEFCGLPESVYRESLEKLDALYDQEKHFRSPERWPNVDWRDYAAAMLGEIDRLIYSEQDFQEYASIEEILGHVEVAERKVAVACRDSAGIYEAERSLKKRWGEQLGLIALEKSTDGKSSHYTLRRVSAVLDFDLNPAYDLLNLLDPAVDGRPTGKRWGGSADIGGSPRPTGTAIQPAELLRLLQRAYQPSGFTDRLRAWTGSAFWTATLLALGGALAFAASVIPEIRIGVLRHLTHGGAGLIAFSLFALVLALALTRRHTESNAWLFGWRRPAGTDWFALAPVALGCAVPASVWVPRNISGDPAAWAVACGVIVLAALGCEAVFRGLVHGRFIFLGPLQRPGGPWMLSRATAASTFFYIVASVALAIGWRASELAPVPDQLTELGITACAALIGGLSLGMIRERSLSLWPGVVLQTVGGLLGATLLWLGL